MAKTPPTELDPAPFLQPVTAPATTASAPAANCPDSLDSSPRSRGTDTEPFFWDDASSATAAPASSAPSGKLRFMCSYGGRIIPRPHDKSLCYLGGETRIVVVDRHASLADLTARLSRQLLSGRPFTLKYQLPHEDLDSVISVTTDDDLDNMIEEYDRSASSPKPSRLRLFLFPAKPDTASNLGSLMEDSKAETWFVDALNGTVPVGLPRGFSDTAAASVNRLLGLDSDVSYDWENRSHHEHSASEDGGVTASGAAGIGKPAKAEVHSVPDSPMMETSSSFESTSSTPSISNLPPVGIKVEDQAGGAAPTAVYAGVEKQLGQMTLEAAKLPPEPELPPARENPAPPPQPAQPAPPIPKPVYYQHPSRVPSVLVATPAVSKREHADQSYRVQMSYAADTGFLVPQPLPPEYHYLHPQVAAIPPPPIPSFYQVHHHSQHQQHQPQQQQVEQPIPMYFLHPQASAMATLRQNQVYNLAAYHSAMTDASSKPPPAPASQPTKDAASVFSYAAVPPPSSSHPVGRPELAASSYRPSPSSAGVPPTSAPIIHGTDPQQYAGYHHPLHPTPHLGYDYGESFPQEVFYNQTLPVSPPSAAAAAAAGEASLQQSPDAKQARS